MAARFRGGFRGLGAQLGAPEHDPEGLDSCHLPRHALLSIALDRLGGARRLGAGLLSVRVRLGANLSNLELSLGTGLPPGLRLGGSLVLEDLKLGFATPALAKISKKRSRTDETLAESDRAQIGSLAGREV